MVCSARQAGNVFVVRENKYSVAQRLSIMTNVVVFFCEYASREAQENLLWKYLYGRSPIERVVANLEDRFPGFKFLPIQKYID
jgi:hypothetical protein